MTTVAAHAITGATARGIARSIEDALESGRMAPGTPLPSVRALARDLGVSPTTVSAAYGDLRTRGVVVTHDRSRTVVSHRPPLLTRPAEALPDGVVDLASGHPDSELLPDLAGALHRLEVPIRLYRGEALLPHLVERARGWLSADGVPADHVVAVSGALDGIERVLAAALRAGDRVAVEDPGYTGVLDLLRAMGLEPVAVPVDDEGLLPDALGDVLGRCAALVMTPRAQNPTGAALSERRADALRELVARHPDLLVVEDDHAGDVAGAAARTLTTGRDRWAVVRSLAKSLGPDLRVALVAGDRRTVARVAGRLAVGPGWVSHVLQRLAVALWDAAEEADLLSRASATYARRREAVIAELSARGIPACGRTGMNVWVPVAEETPVVRGLIARGWAVQAGERYRLTSPPAIRVTVSCLAPEDAPRFAADVASVLTGGAPSRLG